MLDRGANVDCRNAPGYHLGGGDRPLHGAVFRGNVESVEILLKAGADPKAIDSRGRTPLDIARAQLNNNQTNPCNSEEITAQIIEGLEKVIKILDV